MDNMHELNSALKTAVEWCMRRGVSIPADLLSQYALATKDYDYFRATLESLIESLYNGYIGGEFTGILDNLIRGQLGQAYENAWRDSGMDGEIPDYLRSAYTNDYYNQIGYIPQFFRDIIDAKVDGEPIGGLLARADLWANRYNESYNNAMMLITGQEGGNMVWRLGATEKHCETCAQLNGLVARASEWELSGIHPQGAPNALLECEGWNCDCSLEQTDQRRSPGALGTLMNIAVARGL
jgi:hypothetical protein